MITGDIFNSARQGKLPDAFLILVRRIVEGCSLYLIQSGKTTMRTDYKKQYLEAQKQLEDIRRVLESTSRKLKSEARAESWYGHEDYAEGLDRASQGIDRILVQYYSNTANPYALASKKKWNEHWLPSIVWPAFS